LVHLRAAQGHLAADRPAVADLERGHRDARLGHDRLLAGDLRHVGDRVLEHLLVSRRLAHAHVESDLGQARHLHRIGVAELLHELRHHLILVELFQTGIHFSIPQTSGAPDQMASPLERNTRMRRPSSRILVAMRSPLPVAGLKCITLDTWIGASRSITPPGWLAWGFGLVWRLTRLTFDTTTLSPITRTTSPCLPLSLPAVTITWSPFLIRFMSASSAQSTSGASETIFMNFSERSSRVTGPKMRVPIGSCLLLSNTAALPSKRISEPSARRTPLRVRTTTAS